MVYKVGERGQVVIDKAIRDVLGIERGHVATQRLVGDHVEIRFFPPEHTRSLRGALSSRVKAKVSPEQWHEAKERAWERASSLKEARQRDG